MIFKRRGLEKIPLKNCLCEKGCKKRGEEEKKKMDIKILGETFGELYDSHKPERKQLAIDIEGYSD